MELFPKEILAVAKRKGTLVQKQEERDAVPFTLKNEVNAWETLRAIPGREKFLLLLALLATSKDNIYLSSSDLEKFAREPVPSGFTPSNDQVSFLEKISLRHGHSTSFTIAAIHVASRSPYFDKSIFTPARNEDPHFWALLWNFGRPRMPDSVFAPYTLFEAERLLGEPIKDLTSIATLLVPKSATADNDL